MAGVTGITDSKLFKVKRIDLDEPYKVGVNGVVSINEINHFARTKIKMWIFHSDL